MTNTNTPFGLALSRSQDAYYSGVLTQCYVPATNSNKLFVGDAVIKTTGSNTAEVMGHKVGSLPIIIKGDESSPLSGVIVGFVPDGDDYKAGVLPAYKEGIAFVIDNPMAKFNIQANGAVAADAVGHYANLSIATDGNDYSGISGMTLDISTIDGDANRQLKIVGIADYLTNEAYDGTDGTYTVVEVVLNKPAASVDLSAYLTSQTAAETYQEKLTAGANITISDENEISATDTTYTAGEGIAISDENVISATGGQQ